MSQQDVFERVVRSLHEAVLDDSLWDRTSGLIDEACRSMGNQLVVCDDSAGFPFGKTLSFCSLLDLGSSSRVPSQGPPGHIAP